MLPVQLLAFSPREIFLQTMLCGKYICLWLCVLHAGPHLRPPQLLYWLKAFFPILAQGQGPAHREEHPVRKP